MGGPISAFNRTSSGKVQIDGADVTTFYGAGFSAGAAATVEIRDGAAGGALLWSGRLGAAGDVQPTCLPRGIRTANGIYVNFVAGTPTVVVYGA